MPLTWTPDSTTIPWHDVQADEVWTEGPIAALDPEGLLTVTGYDCAVIGVQALLDLHIQTSASGVTVSAPRALTQALPPREIEYQISGATGHCTSFADLPEDADEVIRYLPSTANTKDWILRITARCTPAGVSQNLTADFILRVWANYDPGRDALKKAINARRRQT